MRLFSCQNCGHLYFENRKCDGCGSGVGYLSDEAEMVAPMGGFPQNFTRFRQFVEEWLSLTDFLNSSNRCMGSADLYSLCGFARSNSQTRVHPSTCFVMRRQYGRRIARYLCVGERYEISARMDVGSSWSARTGLVHFRPSLVGQCSGEHLRHFNPAVPHG